MALQKAKKSVQLYGGISDAADSFLVPSPAVEYAENCHWRGKEGKLVKRLGSTAATATGAPTSTEAPSVLHAIKDKLYTFEADSSYEYDPDADSWVSRTQMPFFTRTSSLGKSAVRETVAHDWFEVTAGIHLGKAIFATSTKTSTTVVLYNADGTIAGSSEIVGGFPQIVGAGGGVLFRVIVFDSGSLKTYLINMTDGTTGSPVTIASNVYDGDAHRFGLTYDVTKLPTLESGYPVYTLVTPEEDSDYANGTNRVIAWTNDTTGSMHVAVSSDGFATTAYTYAVTATADYVRPLAICFPANSTFYYILYVEHTDGSPDTNDVIIRLYPITAVTEGGFSLEERELLGAAGSVGGCVSGGMAYEPTGANVHWAITQEDTTEVGVIPSTLTAVSSQDSLNRHRLTTNLMRRGVEVYAGLQFSAYGDIGVSAGNTDQADSFAGWRVPVTNTLVRLTDPTNVEVCCAVDANQSVHVDFPSAWNSNQLGRLGPSVTGDEFNWTSREVFKDASVYSLNGYVDYQFGAQARANAFRVTFTQTTELPGVPLGDGLIIPGGLPLWFDGDVLCELSPLSAPQIVRMADARTADVFFSYEFKLSQSAIVENTRRVQVVCGYTDAKGNIHRSAPSAVCVAEVVPYASGVEPEEQGDGLSVVCAVPMTTNLLGNNNRYFVEAYISDTATGIPKLAGRTNYTPDGSVVAVSCSNEAHVTGGVPSADSLARVRYTEFIYTAGGNLPSDAWPNFTHGVATSTRVWALSKEDQGQVYYSKPFKELVGPEFTASAVLSLGDERQLTAIGRLDDKVVVFEANDIHVVYGAGPDATGKAGRSGGFEVHHVTSDVGCDEPDSVVETAAGLMFKARRGFYLLDRGLNLTFVGGGVQDITRNTRVTAARIVPEFAEVRFHLELDGTQVPETGPDPAVGVLGRPARPKFGNVLPTDGCVVFNYEMARWTVFSNYPAAASALTADGRYARLLSDWSLYIEAAEEDDVWRDGTAEYAMKIRTPHIPLADTVQGYARCRRVTALGRYMSSWALDSSGNVMAGDIKMTPRYDYQLEDGTSRTWRANEELQGGNGRLQMQLRPGKQKCQAIQLLIEEVATTPYNVSEAGTTYSLGRGFEIVDLDFDLGIKEGPARDLSAKRKK